MEQNTTVKEKVLKPILISLMVITIVFAHFTILAINIVSYAIENEADSRNVAFNAYFETENGEKTKNIEKAINSSDINLCMEIEVKNEGILNSQIELSNSNFKFKHKDNNGEGIQEVTDNTITLKQLNAGNKLNIKVGLELKAGTNLFTSTFNSDELIVLKGKYQNAKQKESDVQIEEKVKILLASPYQENEEKINLNTQVITNKIYEINGENKRIVQLLVKSGLLNDGYPIKQTNIQIEVPKEAQNVEVLDRGTFATNGKDEAKNNENTLKIKKQENEVNIQMFNVEEEGKINYRKQETDNFIITCVYDAEKQIQNEEIKTKTQIELYDEKNTKYEKENINKIEEEKDEIIGYEIIGVSSIYKGKVYAKEEQKFKTASKIDIRYPGVEKNIKIVEGKSNYNTVINEMPYEADANTVYKTTTIEKQQLLNVLGDEGELIVKKPDGTEIKRVNKEILSKEENEEITIEYEEGQKEIVIEINNAKNTGTIQLINQKSIKPEENIKREVLKTLNNLTTIGNIEQTNNIIGRNTNNNIILEDSQTRADLEISSTQLLAGTTNENIEIKATLRTNESKYDLYKNPKLEIELPEEVKDVTINSINILYGDELAKQVEEIYENEQGKKIIKLEFAGEQTKHKKEKLVKGINIIINCNLTVESFEESKNNKFILRYSNDKDVVYYNNGISEKEINYIVPEEVKQKLEEQKQNKDLNTKNIQMLGEPQASTDPITLTKSISAGDGNDIYERQVQKYTIKVKNNTNQDISNISVKDTIPEELIYVTPLVRDGNRNEYSETGYLQVEEGEPNESKEFEAPELMYPPEPEKIETLKANEEIDLYYYVRAKKDNSNIDKTVGTKAVATIGENATPYESNEVKNTIKSSKLQIDVITINNATLRYEGGDTLKYKVLVKNITSDTLSNIDVKTTLPESVSFVQGEEMLYSSEYGCYYKHNSETDGENPNIKKVQYDSISRNVTWNIENLESDKEAIYYLEIKLNELTSDEKEKDIVMNASATINNGETAISNEEKIKQISKTSCTVKLETNLEDKYVYEENVFEYIATIKNTGYRKIESLYIQSQLPNGITGRQISYINNGEEINQDIDKSANGSIDIETGETAQIKISVTADKLANGVNELEVKNKVTISSGDLGELNSNEVTNVIKKLSTPSDGEDGSGDNQDNPPDGGNNDGNNNEDKSNDQDSSGKENSQNHSISGVVWLDEDRNGTKNPGEQTMQNVEVELYDESGEDVVAQGTTQNDGKYEISNLKNGKYIVVFKYDSSKYDVTDYKKLGVSEELNSNATKAELDGEFVAITDEITINSANVENINLGLVNSSTFDLKLDKYISSVTVQSSNATKKYSYNNANFAKIEVNRKTVNDTTIIVEYKINVTNEGETAGYARQVIDYKEDGLDFDAKLNRGWSVSNGQLVNSSLSNEIIKPGETKSLTLYLTKKLNENNLGTVTNTAEIGQAYNQNALSDVDSTPNNKKSGEDDMSTVSLIIGIGTGKAIIYTSLIIGTIAMLGVGIYLINKKVLKS